MRSDSELAKASKEWTRALELKPDFPEARKSLDIVQNRMKQPWHVSEPLDQATRPIRRQIVSIRVALAPLASPRNALNVGLFSIM